MYFKINGNNRLEITESMQSAIQTKLSFLNKFLKENDKVSVKVVSEKKILSISILFLYNNRTVKITHNGSEFYSTLDELQDIVKAQMEKRHSFKVKQKKDQDKAFERFESVSCYDAYLEEEDDVPPIVKEKIIPAVPMTEREAALQKEENGYETFIFINADRKNAYCSLYTRNDGTNGLMILSEQ